MDATIELETANWRPFPPFLRPGLSPVEGVGLFAAEYISIGAELGITHVFTRDSQLLKMYPDGWVRCPFAPWYNHSVTRANMRSIHIDDRLNPKPGDYKHMVAIRCIQPGEEILTEYTLYDPST